MDKKYEILNIYGCFIIKALKDFQLMTGKIIKKGDFGGRVDGEHNLSQEGNSWISCYAKAIGDSRVLDDAVLKDRSMAYGNSKISGNAVMKDHSVAYGNVTVSGNAVMKDYSTARDNATISGNAVMNGDSKAYGYSTVSGNAVMKDYSCADGNSIITGNALLQADQCIKYGTVTTDLLGTKDWIGALYAEFGVVPQNNKVILYKKVWKTDNPDVFKSNHHRNFLYKIGKMVAAKSVDEDIFDICTKGLHFTSLEFVKDYDGDATLECEVEIPDIITIWNSQVRARKCRVIGIYKGE